MAPITQTEKEQREIAKKYFGGLVRQDKKAWEKILKEHPFLEEWEKFMKG